MEMLQGDEAKSACRSVDIMSDAVYGILCEGTEFSGNFLIDEEYLRERHGITDFSSYLLGNEEDLQKDFFLPERYDDEANTQPFR